MNAPLGDTPQSLTGLHVVDAEGAKVGIVQQVYRDDATNDPEWITVRTGLFGMKETFVPLAGARRTGDELQVPHTKATIKEAPRIDADGHLDPSEEERLYRHYGLKWPGSGGAGNPGPSGGIAESPAGTTVASSRPAPATAVPGGTGTGAPGVRGRPTGDTGPHRTRAAGERAAPGEDRTRDATRPMAVSRGRDERDERDAVRGAERVPEIVLSEEQVQIATEERETGRAHLRKHVVTEDVHRTVRVTHEEVRVVRERITEEERRLGRTAPRIAEGEVEVVLHEEQVVVSKRTVPVERVRLETERVSEQKEVSAEVRKEELEFDDGRSAGPGERKGPGPEERH
ncbi:photosystem reaction center subunit H [Streptomyces albospinus]|uniref:Photosystem reaction center subunit H n=1 Tax=Streptomyces albospinus TaxID=285515 RepID=A0ABQ2UQE4_9ACTN|nr:PRC and DUF2382 domain-containing protein [Streptomyces albospinus]GGU44774.1 photosystem reaction center subunit H [Streptomyces albospinus]